jgi:hypothetical protein
LTVAVFFSALRMNGMSLVADLLRVTRVLDEVLGELLLLPDRPLDRAQPGLIRISRSIRRSSLDLKSPIWIQFKPQMNTMNTDG